MKSKSIQFFWIGFIFAAIAAALIYRLLRNRREILTGPVIVKKDIVPSGVDDAGDDKPARKADDLSRIKGVGPAFAKRFNEAGIYRFEQLAQTTPEDIREIIGTSRSDSNNWIEEAKVLSEESDPVG